MLSPSTLHMTVATALLLCLSFHWITLAASSQHTDFVLNGFGSHNLTFIGDATLIGSSVLSLTKDAKDSLGRALYPIPLRMKSGNNTLTSFSTTFILAIAPFPQYTPGHGMAFILTPTTSLMGAISAPYLGLFNITTDGRNDSHLFAVEFDTVRNVEFEDINDNHLGIDVNSLRSVNSTPAGYWINGNKNAPAQFQQINLKAGHNIQAWVDYDGAQKHLNITISPAGLPRPLRPLLSVDLDLSDLLEDEMYVGFSAATGTIVESHYVLAWSLNTNGFARTLNTSNLPSFLPQDKHSRFLSREVIAVVCVASVILLSLILLSVNRWRRHGKHEDPIEEWELEYWPHRFAYKELSRATKGFSEQQLLGSGGFGRVYKGTLASNGLEVAVKCVSHESKQGIREFIAEISSMGRLQHRNLVQLRGWCKNQKELLLVYDYMPNRSLDKMIFDDPQPPLAWPERYRVLKGVASGLLYLHEEWEHMVLHRDVKASNVMLDAEFNGRLGDFGLARLYDHAGVHSHTTRVVGTLGYLAPELVHNGKATPSTDVFSFGTLLLEVACGRRPIEHNRPPEELVLGDWVWELSEKDKLMTAADPNLSGQYVVEEMEVVLRLGLLCSHPNPEMRPTMREVVQIFD
eukprot:Gb_13132 [translate_table: standard]